MNESKKLTKDGSDFIKMIIMDNGIKTNLFGNPNMITNRQKSYIPMNFMTNAVSKIVDEVGEIPGAGQTKFHPEMIADALSLNETNKKTEKHLIQETKMILRYILEIILLGFHITMKGFISVERIFLKVKRLRITKVILLKD